MDNLYNNTKEKELVSYELFVETSLDKLGFRKNTLGTRYLKDLILEKLKIYKKTLSSDELTVEVNKFKV